jgi:nucleoside-diphosphate-sugar epimerase
VLPIEIVKLFDSTLAGVAFEERPSALPVASFRSVSDEFNLMAVDAGAAVRTMGQREEERETLSMKILVTGSSGHLGEALIRTLRNKDTKVIGVDLVPSAFTSEVGSIVDRHFVRRCMESVDAVIHTATLHKPHVLTHSRQSFVDSNITGTLNLLEEAALAGVGSFVFTSTTSAFGSALTPPPRRPAAWVTEDVTPMPRNMYGVTKTAAEDLCALFHRNFRLPCLILRTSRFFPEEDDREETRQTYDDGNVKVNEFLYRRIDLEDVVSAHLLAIEKAPFIGFGRYIVSATTPFTQDDLSDLRTHAPLVLKRRIPDYEAEYARRGWKMFPGIDRVYVNERARNDLGWQPQYDFKYVLDRLRAGADPRSPLSRAVGSKGYHSRKFAEGPYPAK